MSTASPSCRVELPAGSAPLALPIALGVAAAAGLAASAMPAMWAAGAWCAAGAIVAMQWRRRMQAVTLTATPPDVLLLGLRDGSEIVAVLRGWRVLGPLLVIDAAVDDVRMRPLVIWQPAMQMNAGRRLRRALASMRPAGEFSV